MEKKEKCHLQCWSQWLILMFLFLTSATVTGQISPCDMHCSGWQHWQSHVVARNPSRMGLPLSREVEIYLTLVNPFFLGIPARDLLEETEIQYLQSKSVEDTKQRVKTTDSTQQLYLFYSTPLWIFLWPAVWLAVRPYSTCSTFFWAARAQGNTEDIWLPLFIIKREIINMQID